MTKKKTETETKPTPVANIADARAKKDAAIETAPLEAYAPNAVKIDGTEDWLIRACDGEQEYMWLATKRKNAKRFTVTEVYPGLLKKRTDLRDADSAEELVLDSKCTSMPDLIEDLEEIVFEGFEEDDEEDGTDG
jgi:hypothetical protein